MIFNFFDKCTLGAAIFLTCSTFLTPIARGAPGFTYDAIYIDGQFTGQNLVLTHAGMNDSGQVVFTTAETIGFQLQVLRTYVASPGETPLLVFESQSFTGQEPGPNIYPAVGGVGINDNGIVAISLIWTILDENQNIIGTDIGYGLFEPGVGIIREIRDFRGSSSQLNINLQMGARGSSRTELMISDGITTESTTPQFINPSTVNVNEAEMVAASAVTVADEKAVYRATPPGAAEVITVGNMNGLGYSSNTNTPGLNDLGWMSYATNNDGNNLNPNPRVLLISPSGDIFLVAETAGSDFVNFWPARQSFARGVGVNNNNRVSFVGQRVDDSESIWIGDASGDEPRLAVEDDQIDFTDGRSFLANAGFANDVTNHGANSLNDFGEIVVIAFGSLLDASGTVLQSSTKALFVARPVAGSEPGNPILPDPADALPGVNAGWRFRGRCWRETVQDILGSCDAFGGVGVATPRQWIDPPIAVGYDYTIDESSVGAFASVLIPVALPGGDSEFLVEVNGAPAVLRAGTVLDFSSVTPDPVRTFRISGIDRPENLDPNDAVAFITGLTFAVNTDEDVSYTMVPVVFDSTDADGDGVPDESDEFPQDPMMSGDPDGDGIDSNVDTDDDGDGVPDAQDDYPWGRFTDAPAGYWSFSFIEALARAGITAGCGSDNYCPQDTVTRAQMAVFLERGINGSGYNPPAATGNLFLDVAAGSFAASFIEQLFLDGITVGCGNDNYCPDTEVTRGQMAVFLLRAKHGSSYSPPNATGIFGDVPVNYWAASWIEQLAAESITAGCGDGNYCPEAPVTRDQMAVFLVRTFDL